MGPFPAYTLRSPVSFEFILLTVSSLSKSGLFPLKFAWVALNIEPVAGLSLIATRKVDPAMAPSPQLFAPKGFSILKLYVHYQVGLGGMR